MVNELSVSRFRKVIREVVKKLGYDQPISDEKLDRIMRFDLNHNNPISMGQIVLIVRQVLKQEI